MTTSLIYMMKMMTLFQVMKMQHLLIHNCMNKMRVTWMLYVIVLQMI
jgi:hypothetical protein